jgi:Transglutaminase-like superfamily
VFSKWRRHTGKERFLLIEAFILLGVARFAILILPFKWLAFSLGKHMAESGRLISREDSEKAQMIGRAIISSANHTPWESVCLPQAVVAQWMLKGRHIAGTLYLGVAKGEAKTEKLAAHAWLRCGDAILTGAANHLQYTVVATFS